MKDYLWYGPDGSEPVRVSQMPLVDIYDALRDSFDIRGTSSSREDVIDRLQIELIIRQRGW